MNAPPKARATVLAVRSDGRKVVFGTYPADEAEDVAERLRRLCGGAEVVDSVSARPGQYV